MSKIIAIAIATGNQILDEKLKNKIEGSKIINYRDYLLKENFNVVIISKELLGEIHLERLLFILKQNNTRIIFLTSYNDEDALYITLCLKYSIFDIAFDPIEVDKILELVKKPNEFKDISTLYIKYINNEKLSDKSQKVSLKDLLGSNEKIEVKNKFESGINKDVKVKSIEKIIEVEKIINTTPCDYKKIIGITGPSNCGKSITALLCANYLTTLKKNVSILDVTENQDYNYYFEKDNGSIEINKRLKIYKNDNPELNVLDNLDLVKENSDVIIIDFDLNINVYFLRFIDNIFIVTDTDLTNSIMVSEMLDTLTKLKVSGQKIKIIFNKIVSSKIIKDVNYLCRYKENEGKYTEIQINKEYFTMKMANKKAYEKMVNFDCTAINDDYDLYKSIANISNNMYSYAANIKNKNLISKLFSKQNEWRLTNEQEK